MASKIFLVAAIFICSCVVQIVSHTPNRQTRQTNIQPTTEEVTDDEHQPPNLWDFRIFRDMLFSGRPVHGPVS